MRPIAGYFDHTSLVNKGFMIWQKDYTKDFAFEGTKETIPSGHDSGHDRPILSAQVANQNTGFTPHSCSLLMQTLLKYFMYFVHSFIDE